ncbi:hypothetical protein EZJ19_01950 [Parasulfuritortus cantonensis]|uniref:Uncharacterized protein n=1 Tax=Parasulfuritortus cantonensis TaxID=2528202 RepID=A0A4R1BM70_9PROT|nr:hypothetical protein [Parasulfuritortus cantonensis]TCJ18499.1 hypothetical protein EZJ19_01950 [Parasulfuritortus cantonensis]
MRNTTKALLFAVMTALTATSALARDRDDNPPGPAGGPGTSVQNPAHPAGGPSVSADVRSHRQWLQKQMTKKEWQHFRTLRQEERQRFCVKKHITKDRCWFDRDDNPPGPRGGPGTNRDNPPGPAGGPGAGPNHR